MFGVCVLKYPLQRMGEADMEQEGEYLFFSHYFFIGTSKWLRMVSSSK